MKGRSALPRGAFLAVLLTVLGGIVGAAWGRSVLARIPLFDVRNIEVVGTRWIAPDSVLQRAAIARDASVWDDFSAVETRLTEHPLVNEAQVFRAGFTTVRVVVDEVEPLALVGVPELRPVRGDGTVLPLEPWKVSVDLPVLTAAARLENHTSLKAGRARTALEIFNAVHELDPGLTALVSDFDLAASGGLEMNLAASQPAARLTLPAEVDERLVMRIRATLADLRHRGIDASALEARYANQIVVRLARSGRESGRQL